MRRSAVAFAGLALLGVLGLGVLQGLVVTAALSLVYVVARLSRPSVGALARDPASGAWGRLDRHPDWAAPDGVLVVRSDGPLLYSNANAVKDRVLALVEAAEPHTVVADFATTSDLDIQAADAIGELADELRRHDIELRLAQVHAPALDVLERVGVTERVRIDATLDKAVRD